MIDPGVPARAKAAEELDGRIAEAFGEDAASVNVALLLQEVETATEAADAEAGEARTLALNPLVVDVIVARRAMDDAAFKRDRLIEAAKRLGKRVDELKVVEVDRRRQAEHERISAERDRLAAEMLGMAEPIVRIARLVREIELCDRKIGSINATSASRFGYIRPVLSGATPAIATLFSDCLVSDAFVAVTKLRSNTA
jgi:hypothetical protein